MHNFHIPVMGIGFTIDTPVKVAHLGISSVISLVGDILIEKMRAMYCKKYSIAYEPITTKDVNHRAKRITSYLNLINDIVILKFNEIKNGVFTNSEQLKRYIELLPKNSHLKIKYKGLTENNIINKSLLKEFSDLLVKGDIDVNIMTKLDKTNKLKGNDLPVEFNDAHAALRGFAESNLNSSVVLSAGLNPRLYAYFDKFPDFFPDKNGNLKKKITLKVSDFRSAFIQGKLLAKRGLWVSEFRIESGLNCGGHAFPTDGLLLGPILEEFKNRKDELTNSLFELYIASLKKIDKPIPANIPKIKITAQGGVGNSQEHNFLIDYYKLDSVGWGSPFLLVNEVVNIDNETLNLLINAEESDLYLSNTSPLGVPFNTLKKNTKDIEKNKLISEGTPGSLCPKQYGAINKEGLCTASRKYQKIKIEELEAENLDADKFKIAYDKIVEKSCICVGLGTSALIVNNIEMKIEGDAVSVCPGPNIAFFDKKSTLKDMIAHIYGEKNILKAGFRPNLFVNELILYYNYLQTIFSDNKQQADIKGSEYFNNFKENLKNGVDYYLKLSLSFPELFTENDVKILNSYKFEILEL